mgnify:CR=1 FL=1
MTSENSLPASESRAPTGGRDWPRFITFFIIHRGSFFLWTMEFSMDFSSLQAYTRVSVEYLFGE